MRLRLNLACFYADIGRPYLPLIERMTKTARQVMPQCRLTLLTPTPHLELIKHFDEHVYLTDIKAEWESLCYGKARAIVTWQEKLEEPCVFVDPDIEFKHPLQFPDADVGLLWRTSNANPINIGMIFARPGVPEFWKRYGAIVASLPRSLRSWWCDQHGFRSMLGSLHYAGEVIQAYDAKVEFMPWEKVCCAPEFANSQTWSVHYKGPRKGEEFKELFQERVEKGKSPCAGTSSQACAS